MSYVEEKKYPKQKKNRRVMIANNIDNVAHYLLPLYNIVFPISYFVICAYHFT